MQTLIDQLQGKIKTYKKQIEEAEEIAALNLAKYRQAQASLQESEQRADLNEHRWPNTNQRDADLPWAQCKKLVDASPPIYDKSNYEFISKIVTNISRPKNKKNTTKKIASKTCNVYLQCQ